MSDYFLNNWLELVQYNPSGKNKDVFDIKQIVHSQIVRKHIDILILLKYEKFQMTFAPNQNIFFEINMTKIKENLKLDDNELYELIIKYNSLPQIGSDLDSKILLILLNKVDKYIEKDEILEYITDFIRSKLKSFEHFNMFYARNNYKTRKLDNKKISKIKNIKINDGARVTFDKNVLSTCLTPVYTKTCVSTLNLNSYTILSILFNCDNILEFINIFMSKEEIGNYLAS